MALCIACVGIFENVLKLAFVPRSIACTTWQQCHVLSLHGNKHPITSLATPSVSPLFSYHTSTQPNCCWRYLDRVGGERSATNNSPLLRRSTGWELSALRGRINLSSGAITYRYGLRRVSSMYPHRYLGDVVAGRREMIHLVLCFMGIFCP